MKLLGTQLPSLSTSSSILLHGLTIFYKKKIKAEHPGVVRKLQKRDKNFKLARPSLMQYLRVNEKVAVAYLCQKNLF